MTSTENDRLDLRQEFERIFNNPRIAAIAMEALPPIDYSQLATKQDLDALSTELRGEMTGLRGELRGEMAELRGELRGDMAEIRGNFAELGGNFAELGGSFAKLEAKVDSGFAEVRGEMAELRGETKGLLGAMDLKMATNVRLFVGGQITTIVLLGGWVAAVT